MNELFNILSHKQFKKKKKKKKTYSHSSDILHLGLFGKSLAQTKLCSGAIKAMNSSG